ncbi:MAG: hypothetical protein Q4C65_02610 [Eubacteriales bacterium]|nr:hypothetical protein [Eubacteriales bacterium]
MEEMRNEEVITETEELEDNSGIGVGLALLIGSGITLAAIAGGKKLKDLYARYKAKRDCTETDETVVMADSEEQSK